MGTIAKNKNVIKLYYNGKTLNDNEAKAYFNSSDKNVLAIDTAKVKVTPTQWSQLLGGLDKDILEIINENHPVLKEKDIGLDASFDMDDWLKIVVNNPEIVRGVLAIIGEEYRHYESPKSVIKLIAGTPDSNNSNRT